MRLEITDGVEDVDTALADHYPTADDRPEVQTDERGTRYVDVDEDVARDLLAAEGTGFAEYPAGEGVDATPSADEEPAEPRSGGPFVRSPTALNSGAREDYARNNEQTEGQDSPDTPSVGDETRTVVSADLSDTEESATRIANDRADLSTEEALEPADRVSPHGGSSPGGRRLDSGNKEFNAKRFIDADWRTVRHRITEGEADSNLAEVRAAEKERENGPRSSVIEALGERDEATADEETTDPDPDAGEGSVNAEVSE